MFSHSINRLISFLLLVVQWTFTTLFAQIGRTEIFDSMIKTVQVKVDGNENVLPVINMGNAERLQLSFDYLSHEYQRFTYNIQHCDFLGNKTESLFSSDYVYAASDDEVIDDYEYSTNTTVLYTHYKLTLPNVRMRPLLSGNYRLTVFREDETGYLKPVLHTFFAVLDNQVLIHPSISTNTDVDWNENHQQLSLEVVCNELKVRDANRDIKVVVMQNRRLDSAIWGPTPSAQNGTHLYWNHQRQMIFPAGNEYRKFEMLSTRYPGMHIDYIRWYEPYYHVVLLEDEPRKNYLFDKDINGMAIVRCEDSAMPDIEADYVLAHFTLRMPALPNYEVYINGGWSGTGRNEEYKMTYNSEIGAYETSVLLKLGYYNYQYLCVNPWLTSPVGETKQIEGDFYQTQNQYDILVYYMSPGSRYQQLVGYVSPIFRP